MVLFFKLKPKKCNYRQSLFVILLFVLSFVSCKTASELPIVKKMPSIGEQIRYERISKGLSQKELADAVKLSAEVLSLVEDGLATPLPSKVAAIQEYLGIELVYN
jgi:ribosome-binding protein aMBF1 (putative translation factor)